LLLFMQIWIETGKPLLPGTENPFYFFLDVRKF